MNDQRVILVGVSRRAVRALTSPQVTEAAILRLPKKELVAVLTVNGQYTTWNSTKNEMAERLFSMVSRHGAREVRLTDLQRLHAF